MQIARNHKTVVLHIENFHELEDVVRVLAAVSNPAFPVPAYIGDGERKLKVNSLKGFIATVRLEDVMEIQEGG